MRFWRRYRPKRAIKPAYPSRPRLEQLEDRCVPNVDMVINTSGSALVQGSLPYEVANANSGDTIQFAASLNGATITLNNTLDINKKLTIDGTGDNITVNGGGNPVFLIEGGVTADINALTITGGTGNGFITAGGIYNAGSLSLTNSTVTGNSAAGSAGIHNTTTGTMTMIGDTVNNNTATGSAGYGGGISNLGHLTIINCTIAANQAFRGGGIANFGVLNVDNSTVAFNTVKGAGADGGGIYSYFANTQLALLNTIVFNPNSGAATNNDVVGTIAHAQGDLFGSAVSIAGGGDLGGNQENVNPLLGPLQNNGGPTATMALLANSPVGIGQGANASAIPGLQVTLYDQRGYPRPAESEDVGAVQTQTWVAADFVGQGVQAYVFGSWHALSPYAAQSVAVDGAGDVVASFAGAGLWYWTLAGGWMQIDSYTPQSIAVGSFGQVTAAFTNGGLWQWSLGTWTQIDSYTPQSIAADGDGNVVAAFAGAGVWQWSLGTWTQIDNFTPQSLAVDGGGNVVASFAGSGLWRWTLAGGWTQIDGVTPQQFATDAGGDVFATFAGGGLWRWTLAGGWTQIDSFTPQQIAADADGDVVAAFGDGTLWRWLPGNTWTKLIPGPVDALGASQF
jgi:hypothetical protein